MNFPQVSDPKTPGNSSFSKKDVEFFTVLFPLQTKQPFTYSSPKLQILEILSGDSTRGAILRFQSGTTVVPGNGLGLWKEVPWMQHGAGHGETNRVWTTSGDGPCFIWGSQTSQVPSWERSHIPYQPAPFESMIFRTSRLVGYVSSLEGSHRYLSTKVLITIFITIW